MSKPPKEVKHRMRRPQPPDAKPGRRVYDIKKAYTAEQLAEIGAIALTWNQVEVAIDWLLLVVVKMPVGLWTAVTSRINGMDGKLAILRLRIDQAKILTDEARQCITLALDAVAECKSYRDAIVHSLTFDVDKGIAQQFGRRAQVHEVIVTMPALSGVYARLTILQAELDCINLLYRCADEEGARLIYHDAPDPLKSRQTRDVPVVTAQVLEHQNRRRSLPLLPEFPEKPPSPSDWMSQFAIPPRQAFFHPGLVGPLKPDPE